jgi:hypothetical protein
MSIGERDIKKLKQLFNFPQLPGCHFSIFFPQTGPNHGILPCLSPQALHAEPISFPTTPSFFPVYHLLTTMTFYIMGPGQSGALIHIVLISVLGGGS